jgi:hypothetical protein
MKSSVGGFYYGVDGLVAIHLRSGFLIEQQKAVVGLPMDFL